MSSPPHPPCKTLGGLADGHQKVPNGGSILKYNHVKPQIKMVIERKGTCMEDSGIVHKAHVYRECLSKHRVMDRGKN